MARIRPVHSRQNSRVKALRAAFDRPGRMDGPVALEGEHLLVEAIRSRITVQAVFVIAGQEHHLDRLPLAEDCEILALPEDVFFSVVTTESPQPIAGLVEAPHFELPAVLGKDQPLVIVTEALQDPGNLGTLIRSAEAFGATGIIALPGTVSHWNPKALRASSGSVFRLPVVNATVGEMTGLLRERGVRLFAAVAEQPGQTAHPHPIGDLRGPSAILIGNEGAGLSRALIDQTQTRISIPCPGITESLNAAVAGSVLLYEASRQRSRTPAGRGEAP